MKAYVLETHLDSVRQGVQAALRPAHLRGHALRQDEPLHRRRLSSCRWCKNECAMAEEEAWVVHMWLGLLDKALLDDLGLDERGRGEAER